MSVANYEHLMRVLGTYLDERGASPADAGVRLNRLVYKTMTDVEDSSPHDGTYAKNKMTVEVVAAFVANVLAGQEPAPDARAPPPCDSGPRCPPPDAAERSLERLAAARADVDLGDPYADFRRAVADSVERTGSAHSALRPDLSGLRANIGSPCDPPGMHGGLLGDATAGLGSGSDGPGGSHLGLPDAPGPKRVVRRYLMVNGYDRNWDAFPERFSFTVNLANADAAFKDIRSIAATRLIVPREITEERTLTTVPKTRFEQPFNLQYPYLILRVREFQSVYKGSNQASQNAFCHFVYDTHYTSPNGRGYIHLVPAQKEALEFHINPLASLQHLDLAVQRPNGELLNASRDRARVLRMDWNNQVNQNRQLVMVTLRSFFDRNEFFAGDTVRFTGFSLPGSANLEAYVNREQGHDILEFGTPNAEGYVNSFFVRVPGAFNAETGVFDVDVPAVTALMDFIGGIDYVNDPPDSIALVINASLQASVSFEIRVEEEDVTV